jgi:lysophospholipase L1-like esterase
MQGWGTPIALFFDSDKVKVSNMGHAGTSSMSYYNGDWPRVVGQVKSGDFVLIVFGINDGTTLNGIGEETRPAAARGGARGARGPATTPAPGAPTASAPATPPAAGPVEHTYGWYMAKMATDALAKGGHPVFLTVTTRNIWTNPKATFKDATPQGALPPDYDPAQDKIEHGTGNGKYTQWTKDVAKNLHLPVFDLTNYCADLYEKMGRENVNKMYQDHNHTHAVGALTVATAIASGLKGLKDSPFVPLMSEKGKALTAADAKYISDNSPDPAAAPAMK